jgi:formamidopyrimidine-DNA glycosylase
LPELPEVETVKRAIGPLITGNQITHVFVGRKDLRWALPVCLESQLSKAICHAPYRRGKYILIPIGDEQTLLLHLGMSGSIRIYPNRPNLQKHDHFAIGFEGNGWLVFSDPRRFGYIDLFANSDITSHRLLKILGPEPLSEEFTPEYLSKKVEHKTCSIKSFLLDQTKVAGIGNIYASEALFKAGISPKRQAKTIKGKRAERLVPAIQVILKKAIEAGGTSLRDHIQPGGEIGYFVQSLQMYGRGGESCPNCSAAIRVLKQSGRTSFYCGICQR